MEKWRFDREWVKDQWETYLKESKQNGTGISAIGFTDMCIRKVKNYLNDKK